MPTTVKRIEEALGSDKLTVLAAEVDHLNEEVRNLQERVALDDQIETLDVHELAKKFDVSFDTLRKQITGVLGENTVFKVGKKWVIRKRRFLDFLQSKESVDLSEN